jgi:RNA polymerase sigma-70 factor (ECF subfamily)
MNFTLSDTLLKRIRHRDEDAFRELMKLSRSFAWGCVYRWVRNREDALDIIQEGYIKVWKGIDGYDPKSSFQSWFRGILRNQTIDWWRKHGRVPAGYQEQLEQSLHDSTAEQPDRVLEQAEIGIWIRNGLSQLPETQRLVFMLRDLEGMSIREVQDETGLTEASIKSNLYLARKWMAEEMGRVGYGRRKTKGERRKKEIR